MFPNSVNEITKASFFCDHSLKPPFSYWFMFYFFKIKLFSWIFEGVSHIWIWQKQLCTLCWYGLADIYIWQCFASSFCLWHTMQWSAVSLYSNGLHPLTIYFTQYLLTVECCKTICIIIPDWITFWQRCICISGVNKQTFQKTAGSMKNSNDVQHRINENRGWTIMRENSCIFDIYHLFIYITNGVLLIM